MEPFRPLVDWTVKQLADEEQIEMVPEIKKRLAGILKMDIETSRGRSPVSNCLLKLAQSLVNSFTDRKPGLDLPGSVIPLAAEIEEL